MLRGWRRTVVAAGALAVMAACGGGAGADYPPEVVDQFLASCTAQGTSREVCQCALDRLEDQYSLDEFTAEAQALARGEASPEFTENIISASVECQQELG